MAKHVFSTGKEATSVYGAPTVARRTTLVKVRAVDGQEEVFKKKHGDLTAKAGEDVVLVPVDGSAPYPCKIHLFTGETGAWEETEQGSGVYRRKALCKYLQVPEGDEVVCKTKEGDVTVTYPDAIAIGVDDEVYSYRKEWIEGNLETVS